MLIYTYEPSPWPLYAQYPRPLYSENSHTILKYLYGRQVPPCRGPDRTAGAGERQPHPPSPEGETDKRDNERRGGGDERPTNPLAAAAAAAAQLVTHPVPPPPKPRRST